MNNLSYATEQRKGGENSLPVLSDRFGVGPARLGTDAARLSVEPEHLFSGKNTNIEANLKKKHFSAFFWQHLPERLRIVVVVLRVLQPHQGWLSVQHPPVGRGESGLVPFAAELL